MKKALIDPRFKEKYISSWQIYKPVYSEIENSARICQIEDSELSVTPPLFWVSCSDNINPGDFYYDTESQTIKIIQNEPRIERFTSYRIDADEFDVYRVFAKKTGAITTAGDSLDINRGSESIRVSMMTKGSRLYESSNGLFQPVTMVVGNFNLDLPNMTATDSYKITALEDNTEYFCISRKDLTPYEYVRLSLSTGQSVTLPANKYAFIGGGDTNLGSGPILIRPDSTSRNIQVTTGNVFGIIF